ncbi:hypothetical protein HY345_01125 [Candidatus Microgenomates bacterium]|nr:hypothetical protein [Candidatus Microgenomates bacterium]
MAGCPQERRPTISVATTTFLPEAFVLRPKTTFALARAQGIHKMEVSAPKPVIQVAIDNNGRVGVPVTSLHEGWGGEIERKKATGDPILLADHFTCSHNRWGDPQTDHAALRRIQKANGNPLIVTHTLQGYSDGKSLELYSPATIAEMEQELGIPIRTAQQAVDAFKRLQERHPYLSLTLDSSERRWKPFCDRIGLRHTGERLNFLGQILPLVNIHHLQVSTNGDYQAIMKPQTNPEIRAITRTIIERAPGYAATVLELNPIRFAGGLGRNVRDVVQFVKESLTR